MPSIETAAVLAAYREPFGEHWLISQPCPSMKWSRPPTSAIFPIPCAQTRKYIAKLGRFSIRSSPCKEVKDSTTRYWTPTAIIACRR
jgi:hypothetical protein